MIRYLLFDLDDTLYPRNSGLWEVLSGRISRYMIERLRIDAQEVPHLRQYFAKNYGTALNGLRHSGFEVDVMDYLAFVHEVPITDYLQPNPELEAMLGRLPLPKAVLTNADAAHSQRVMRALGVAHHFPTIIDIVALEFVNKPEPLAYHKALAILGAEPAECVFVEDSRRNLLPAKALGMKTIWVSEEASLDGVDYQVQTLLEVEGVIKQLLKKN